MWKFIVLAYLIGGLTDYDDLFVQGHKNLESDMDVCQMIFYHGYQCEEHEVLTDDGYYLTMHRIPQGRKDIGGIGSKPAVLMLHGLLGEASHWVENLANNSLGFILADAGYDIWLGNCRGTCWSRKHETFSVDQAEFWDFSFHEMGIYDIPAFIDFILKETKQKQLYYVGHSQGSAIGFIAFSETPGLSEKIKMFIALAPVVYVAHVSNRPLKFLMSLPQVLFEVLLGDKVYTPDYKEMIAIRKTLCTIDHIDEICPSLIFIPDTYNTTNLNMSRIDVYAAHYPDITSTKTIIHWKQVLNSGEFRCFDYGEEENKMIYNQNFPPLYQVENMKVPTAVWFGGHDTLADPEDVELLCSHIPNLVYCNSVLHWNHMDSIWGCDAAELMFHEIVQTMNWSM